MALSGIPSLTVALDRASVQAAERAFADALRLAAPEAVREMAAVAVRHLRDLDDGLGRNKLAELWDATPVQDEGDGWSAEVYSRAEGMEFWNDTTDSSGARVKSDRHSVQGEDLIAYLQYGVAPHTISASEAGRLTFPITPGEKASDFVGTAETEHGTVAGLFKGGGAQDHLFVGLDVHHPGFAGSHTLEAAADVLERGIDLFAAETGTNVSEEFER
jgi:hypothetical protein